MIWTALKFLFTGPLDRLLSTVEHRVDNETERERIKSDVTKAYIEARAQVLVKRTWWFQLIFVLPLGFWWAAINVYSVLWCKDCAYPQEWTIAALPPPLDDWAAGIVTALFLLEGVKRVRG